MHIILGYILYAVSIHSFRVNGQLFHASDQIFYVLCYKCFYYIFSWFIVLLCFFSVFRFIVFFSFHVLCFFKIFIELFDVVQRSEYMSQVSALGWNESQCLPPLEVSDQLNDVLLSYPWNDFLPLLRLLTFLAGILLEWILERDSENFELLGWLLVGGWCGVQVHRRLVLVSFFCFQGRHVEKKRRV